jgi:preprotein translocase subunit YajC
MIILLPLFLLMYFLVLRPQQTRMRRQRQLMQTLAVGQEVLTAGGVIGTITALDDREAHLSVGPGLELRVVRGAISGRLDNDLPDVADPADGVEADGAEGD